MINGKLPLPINDCLEVAGMIVNHCPSTFGLEEYSDKDCADGQCHNCWLDALEKRDGRRKQEMTIERLKELKVLVRIIRNFCDMHEDTYCDLVALIDEKIASLSVTSEEVQGLITYYENGIRNDTRNLEIYQKSKNRELLSVCKMLEASISKNNIILTALHQYRKPVNQFEKWKAGLTMEDTAVMLDGMADCYSCPAYRRCSEHFGERCQDAFIKWGEQRA